MLNIYFKSPFKMENYQDAVKKEKYYKSSAGRRKLKSIFDALEINK